MISPRIYWLCPHTTLRYEEIPLLIEAGAEVIPNFGYDIFLEYYPNYNNENDKLYPHFRKSCALPTNIVEKIRQIELWQKKGKVTWKEAEFINRWIDVIFVATHSNILENIRKWYQGYIVFRVFGCNDGVTTYTELMNENNIDINDIEKIDKYVWCPIINSLEDREDSKIIKNKFYLNAFVSQKRLGYRWNARDSKPFITTLISNLDSYYNEYPSFRDLFQRFSKEFSKIPYVVLGRNSKDAVKDICDKVLGYVDDDKFYSKIAQSRIFVYFGLGSNYHVHFTPIEAISMGVPVIFLKKSGLAQEARDHGVSNEELVKIGMCNDIKEMNELVVKIMEDFDELERMSQKQFEVFGDIFSREAALKKTREFYKKIQPYILQHRKIQYARPISFDVANKNNFQRNSIGKSLPTQQGQRVLFSAEGINAFNGKLVYDYNEKFIARRVEQEIDSPGLFIANYLWEMQPGEYIFSMELNSFDKYNSSIGTFLIGVWNPQFKILNIKDVAYLKKGKNLVNLIVKIPKEYSNILKEIEFIWNGKHTCEISSIAVEKLT